MTCYTRKYVDVGAEMYRAVAYDAAGNALRAAGPYASRRAAAAQRNGLRWGSAVRVCVEVCRPTWEPVPGTEVTA